MATVNIGNLTFTHRGDYAGGTAYAKNDVVYYATNGNAYIAKQATTGNAPTNATYWSQFAQGSGGIWNAGLSLGSAGEVVKVNTAGNALEFGTAPSGKIVSVHYAEYLDTVSQSGTFTYRDVPNLSITITPQSVDSKFLIMMRVSMGTDGNHTYARINAGGNAVHVSNAYASAFRSTSAVAAKATWDMDELTGQYLWDANSSSAVTIKAQYAGESDHFINRGQRDNGQQSDARATSSLTVFEIDN